MWHINTDTQQQRDLAASTCLVHLFSLKSANSLFASQVTVQLQFRQAVRNVVRCDEMRLHVHHNTKAQRLSACRGCSTHELAHQRLPHKTIDQLKSMLAFARSHRLHYARWSALQHSWQHQQKMLAAECEQLLSQDHACALDHSKHALEVRHPCCSYRAGCHAERCCSLSPVNIETPARKCCTQSATGTLRGKTQHRAML